jgi:hypothetical protein
MKMKRPRSRRLLSGAALAASVSLGCQKEAPLDPAALAAETSKNVAAIFQSAALSADGNRNVERATSRVGDGIGTISGAFDSVETSGGTPGPMPAIPRMSALAHLVKMVPSFRATARPLATESLFGPSPVIGGLNATAQQTSSELASDLDETGEVLGRVLRERIFAEGNLESKTDSEAIYFLKADPTCRDLDTGDIDKKCADEIKKVEFRVRLSKTGAAASIELLIGAGRVRPGRLVIGETQIALELFLADLKETVAILTAAYGGMDDTPDVMTGALRWALTKEAEKRVSFSAGILAALEIENKAGGKDDPARITSAASDPIFKLTADGDKGTITTAVNLGASDIHVPWNPKDGAAPNTDLHIGLAGITGEISFSEAADELTFSRLGVGPGPLFVEVRGQRIFQYDLNPNDGRAFDLTIGFDGETPRMGYRPRFEQHLAFKLGLIASDFKKAPPAALSDESYTTALEPAGGQTPVVAPWKGSGPDQEGMRVVAGRLTLSSSKGPSVIVNAGECLVSSKADASAHPVLGAFKATPCP